MLAIGFCSEENFCVSMEVSSSDAQNVANQLRDNFGTIFDQILLVKNGDLVFNGPAGHTSPEVVHHWNIDRDYDM